MCEKKMLKRLYDVRLRQWKKQQLGHMSDKKKDLQIAISAEVF